MDKNITIAIGFVIFVIILCKLWNIIALRIYKKNKFKMINNYNAIKYRTYIDGFDKLEVVGIGTDGNSDFEFRQAVKKISLPDDIRIQIYD